MSSESPGTELNVRIGKSSANWTPVFQRNGAHAPWHHVLSQIIAVIGDKPDSIRFADSLIPNSANLDTLTLDLVIYTDDLMLRSTMTAGAVPELSVFNRRELSGITVLEVPVITFEDPYAASSSTRVRLTYPTLELVLPLSQSNRSRGDEVHGLLPSLVADLTAV